MENNQEKHQFMIAQMVFLPEGVIEIVKKIQTELSAVSKTAKIPKMEPHCTIIPPFYATKAEMNYLNIGLNSLNDFYNHKHGNSRNKGHYEVTRSGNIVNMKFFKNPKNDVLVFILDFPMVYGTFLKAYRDNLSAFVNYVHQPAGDGSFIPHVTLIEGLNLAEAYKILGTKKYHANLFHSESLRLSLSFGLSLPKIMIKVGGGTESRWEAFFPLKPEL